MLAKEKEMTDSKEIYTDTLYIGDNIQLKDGRKLIGTKVREE
jgi:hypothetical protein